MLWNSDRRIERIASRTMQLGGESLAAHFHHCAERSRTEAPPEHDDQAVVSQIEDPGVRLLHEGAERMADDLATILNTPVMFRQTRRVWGNAGVRLPNDAVLCGMGRLGVT